MSRKRSPDRRPRWIVSGTCRQHNEELHAIGRAALEPNYEIFFEIVIEGLFTGWSARKVRLSSQGVSADWKPLQARSLK